MTKAVNDPATRIGTMYDGTSRRMFVKGEILRQEPHVTMRDKYYQVTRTGVTHGPYSPGERNDLRKAGTPGLSWTRITKESAQKLYKTMPWNVGHAVRFNMAEELLTQASVGLPPYSPLTHRWMDEGGVVFSPAGSVTASVNQSAPQPEPTQEAPVATTTTKRERKKYTLEQMQRKTMAQAKEGGHKMIKWMVIDHWAHSRCVQCGATLVVDPKIGSEWGAVARSGCDAWIERTQNGFSDIYKTAIGVPDPDTLEESTSANATVISMEPEVVVEEVTDQDQVVMYEVVIPGIPSKTFKTLEEAERCRQGYVDSGWFVKPIQEFLSGRGNQ